MSDAITADQFRSSPGTGAWSVDGAVATATFETGDFATGLTLVQRIGDLAEAANHHPDIDLRYPQVTVRLTSHDIEALSQRDADLAGQISAAAGDVIPSGN